MNDVINERRRGRPRAFDRDAVLEQAMAAFWAHGYDATSLPMLTDAMGISAQSLYAAFGSKEALYRAALERYRTTIGGFGARALDEEPDALAAIARLLHDAADVFARPAGTPGCMIVTAPSGTGEDPLALLGRTLRTEGATRIAARLEQGRRDGQIRLDADLPSWARYITGVVQGMSVQARDGASRDTLREIANIAVEGLVALRA